MEATHSLCFLINVYLHCRELEIRFDMDPLVADFGNQNEPLPVNWALRFIHNQLFKHFEFTSRFCPGKKCGNVFLSNGISVKCNYLLFKLVFILRSPHACCFVLG